MYLPLLLTGYNFCCQQDLESKIKAYKVEQD